MRTKGILGIFGVCALALVLTACGGGKEAKANDEAKLPLSEQKATSLIKDKKATGPDEDYSEAEIAAIGENEFFSHLANDSGAYANVLKHSYLKNLMFQDLKNEKGETIKVGSLVKDQSKPTLFMITRSNCPYCQEVLEELTRAYNPKDFNLILGEGHISEKEDIGEDLEGVQKELEIIGDNRLKDHYAYGVDPMMDELHAVYYPTLIYLDSNGYIVNVSGSLTYPEIMDVFAKTLGGKTSEDAEKEADKTESDVVKEVHSDPAKVDSEIVTPNKAAEQPTDSEVGKLEKSNKE